MMRGQCDEVTGARQQERAQGTDKCLTGHPAPALLAARDTSFLAGPGLPGASKGALESHSSRLGPSCQQPCDRGQVSSLSLHLLLNGCKTLDHPAGLREQ